MIHVTCEGGGQVMTHSEPGWQLLQETHGILLEKAFFGPYRVRIPSSAPGGYDCYTWASEIRARKHHERACLSIDSELRELQASLRR